MNALNLNHEFQKTFTISTETRTFFAPGRINLIGEHTDYNGGHVFPASISFGTYAVVRKREDRIFRFCSLNFQDDGIIECELSNLAFNTDDGWANYPKGMIHHFQKAGYEITHGADILYYGNIPNGAGLSSSASIELVTGVLLEQIYQLQIDRITMAKIGQQVENEYMGVNSGIMDQFAIGLGKQDHAILLNCETLDFHYAPLQLNDHRIIIMNSNKQRTLAGSKYNERRAQCESALKELQSALPITSLGQLTKSSFDNHQQLITNELNRKRAKHAVYENARTLEALERLNEGDIISFGKLMNESHESLRQDYEVTGIELDTLVEAANQQQGVLGARMTGAGFGGCAIAIVEKDRIEDFKRNVNDLYSQKVGYSATFYTATIGNGAREIIAEEVL
ncbi:galactokinase [Ornithinibacillus contaminans]|uniref:galactokinase n=1 Tax=Ornithinibacillus contaminans TaxID=694055 RepID=UPI00064DCD27|nr:galactokinase [Ornithinibacillus contaminans]